MQSKWTFRGPLLATGMLAVALLFATSTSSPSYCLEAVDFDASLPLSHPTNRCALQASNSLSWYSWLVGGSGDGSMHFLDLLELLSRDSTPAPHYQPPQDLD